jgi:hypothetical protein
MMANYAMGAAKKALTIDKDYLIVILIFMIVLFGSKAYSFSITAPDQVIVQGDNNFYIDIINDTDKQQTLEVNFYSPLYSQVIAPKTISPKSVVTAKISLTNTKFGPLTQINSTLEVNMGGKIQRKEIPIAFKEKQVSPAAGAGAFISGVFSFAPTIQELSKFTLLEWVAFWVLVVIAAILVIAFIVRVKNRV